MLQTVSLCTDWCHGSRNVPFRQTVADPSGTPRDQGTLWRSGPPKRLFKEPPGSVWGTFLQISEPPGMGGRLSVLYANPGAALQADLPKPPIQPPPSQPPPTHPTLTCPPMPTGAALNSSLDRRPLQSTPTQQT